MATIANLAIGLVARTGTLDKGFRRAIKRVSAFTKRVGGLALKFSGIGAAIGAIGGAAGIGFMLKKQAAAINQTTVWATKLGIGEKQLTGLQLAAKRAGLEQNNFNTGLQRMVRRIGEASKGTGEAKGALKELGLLNRDFVALSPEEQFIAVAKAMNGIARQQDRVRLAFKLFDTEGVGFVNIFAMGARNIRRAMGDAETFGLSFDKRFGGAVFKVGNLWDDLTAKMQGFFRQIVLAVAPVLVAVLEVVNAKFAALIEQKGGMANFARVLVADVLRAILALWEGIGKLIERVRSFVAMLSAIGKFVDLAKLFTPMGAAGIGASVGKTIGAGKTITEDPQIKQVIGLLSGLREDFQKFGFGYG